MLFNRIFGAFTFRKGIYAEVEKDESFTSTAWMLVAVVAFLSQLGSNAGQTRGLGAWLLATVLGSIFAVVAFAVGAWVISWVGKAFFKADVNFGEMVRVLGLAYVWQAIGILGILNFFPVLACVAAPIALIAVILAFIAWLVAAKEALDLDWVKTIVTIILGWIAIMVISFIASMVLGLFGLTVAGLGKALGG